MFLGLCVMTYLSSVGHKGRFGHEFLEFEFRPNGKLRYANNSRYKQETIIRKEGTTTPALWHSPLQFLSATLSDKN